MKIVKSINRYDNMIVVKYYLSETAQNHMVKEIPVQEGFNYETDFDPAVYKEGVLSGDITRAQVFADLCISIAFMREMIDNQLIGYSKYSMFEDSVIAMGATFDINFGRVI